MAPVSISLLVLLLTAAAACGQVKSSARNLQPLTRAPESPATAQAAETAIGTATAPGGARQESATRVTYLGPTNGWGFVKSGGPY